MFHSLSIQSLDERKRGELFWFADNCGDDKTRYPIFHFAAKLWGFRHTCFHHKTIKIINFLSSHIINSGPQIGNPPSHPQIAGKIGVTLGSNTVLPHDYLRTRADKWASYQ